MSHQLFSSSLRFAACLAAAGGGSDAAAPAAPGLGAGADSSMALLSLVFRPVKRPLHAVISAFALRSKQAAKKPASQIVVA